ncbi:Colicin V production protein [Pseudobutyrivibrio sp. 49]|uniref:CvpA family protein n=1 Tax=unclassified Pseudobutyrivibrio TaxID=2638619 RepID=UPI00088A6FAE|nr:MULTISPECIES: CvpA family protein [unclassified Pseudobutyrivibrio]SDH67131.1 Colicin V production protein [Pseudobutyrivibrio sp. 49]SFN71557.1 Colicin V production protein [Pseudobutyrivibrio sp. UC1225]
MAYVDRIVNNPVFLVFILLMLFCIIRGAKRGMLKIVYGLVSWIFLICFVNFACGVVSDYLNVNTPIPTMVQESIVTHLKDKYISSEQEEEGTGEDAVMKLVPASVQEKLDETIQTSIDTTIQFISAELSETAIHGIAMVISVIAGSLALFLLSRAIELLGFVPGIRGVNRSLGVLAGFGEGILITWVCMYLANCFPTTQLGSFIIEKTEAEPILTVLYNANIIERIIGI